MKEFIFKGTETRNLAGIGITKPGDKIQVDERTADYIITSGDKSFQLVQGESAPDNSKRVPYGKKNPYYDLRRVPWDRSNIGLILGGLPPNELRKIGDAINNTKGAPKIDFDKDTAREVLVDGIMVAAKAAGWLAQVQAPEETGPLEWALKEGGVAGIIDKEGAPEIVKLANAFVGVVFTIEPAKEGAPRMVKLDFLAHSRNTNTPLPQLAGKPLYTMMVSEEYLGEPIQTTPAPTEEDLPPAGIA